ncbi:major facilitator superfamily domain-containing protein [Microdochium trichocladiopsis]|uniref:Major facilitator superfamily domain-containing protein n=1 Tax=Microdochium trichocladiopsis TaxID=1682393 RepID=A0A9P8XXM8_9PEZI|nr:major facilitator superfamily domain-containing protein [Microdochium trichocladiopsis]KAH7024692.1 major facilitator superfamily domain-containing protein [Microdochium trichocladiopsis]
MGPNEKSRPDDVKVLGAETGTATSGSLHDAPASAIEDDNKALESRVTRKIDMRVVPMLCALYLTAYLDRTNIGNARLLGLEAELKMPSDGYNTAIWVFFLTFPLRTSSMLIILQVPSNLVMARSKIPPHWWLGISMTLLGIVTMCQGFVRSPAPLYVCRAIMGIFEGSLGPAAALMMGSYYRKHEFPLRYCCFTTSALVGASFSSFLAYAISFMDDVQGISAWRWIFILEGLFNIVVALFTFVVLPPFPAESTFLAPEEKQHLLDRLYRERGDEADTLRGQPWMSFLFDWQTWLNIVMYFGADMSAAAISQFSPTILNELGWTANEANLRNVPIWLVGAFFAVTANILAGRLKIRFPFILFGATLCTIGWAIQLSQANPSGVRYFALYFIATGAFIQLPMCVAWLSANLVGRPRKAVAHALQIGFGNSANFVSANVFITTQRPKYPTGFTTGLVITVVGLVAASVLEYTLWTKNKQADRREAKGEPETKLVGKDGVRFRYTL